MSSFIFPLAAIAHFILTVIRSMRHHTTCTLIWDDKPIYKPPGNEVVLQASCIFRVSLITGVLITGLDWTGLES